MKTTRAGKQRPARYRSVQWPTVVMLTLVWWVLWGSYSALTLAGGVIVAVLVCLVFPLPPLRLQVRLHPWGLTVLIARFHWDVFMASAEVAWTTIFPPKPLTSALVAVKLKTESDFVLTVVGELTSLVPGSVVVEAHRATHTLYLHALNVKGRDEIAGIRERVWKQEMRVVRAFGGLEETLTEEVPA